MATPVLALVCDGAYYDVAALERTLGIGAEFGGHDFHARVVSARCAGLGELEARVLGGQRPSSARLMPGAYLPLPPCDPDRAAYLALGDYDEPSDEPSFHFRDSRALVGDAQPVSVAHHTPRVGAGVAVLLGEDLWRARAREVARAIHGVTLFMAWGRLAPTHLGTELLIGQRPRDIADLVLRVGPRDAPHAERRVGDWRFEPAEAIAFLSQHVQLRGGDVIGLGSALAVEPAWGESVALSLGKLLRLEGRAQPAPAPPPWRLNR